MKKRYSLVFLFAFLFLVGNVSAANWYVKSNGGTGAGSDWNTAWSMSGLNSKWASVQPGDTIWIAGGTYSGGIQPTTSGTSANWIYIKRPLSSDSVPTAAAGWSNAFDSQVIINGDPPLYFSGNNVGNYLSIDGRIGRDGISARYPNTANALTGALSTSTTGSFHDVVLNHIDLAGPGGSTPFNYAGDAAVVNFRGGAVYNLNITNCQIHGAASLFYVLGSGKRDIVIDHCTIKDSGSSNSAIHANIFYMNGALYNWIFSNNDFSNWQVEGFSFYELGQSAPWYFYGNVFHDPMVAGGARAFWLADEQLDPLGPIYLYNNVFDGVYITFGESRASQFSSGSIARNNIYLNSQFYSGSRVSNTDYNYGNVGSSDLGANGISSSTDPFVNSAIGNYNISSTSPVRNKGALIANSGGQVFNVDPNGNIRGSDGTWDIGAYEYTQAAVTCTTCHYIRQGATGLNNGNDWTNAWTTLPATLTRGHTYYIADGNYSGYTFDDAPSGNQYITVKKASESNHGTDVGWQTTYGDGQAIFTSGFLFRGTGQIIFDGSYRNENDWFDGSAYGFKIYRGNIKVGEYATGTASSDLTISNVYIDLNIAPTSGFAVDTYVANTGTSSGLTFSRMYVSGGCNVWFIKNARDITIEYSASSDVRGDGTNHGEIVNLYTGISNITVRYNKFRDAYLTGGGTALVAVSDTDGLKMYGNLAWNFKTGNGAVGMGPLTNSVIYGNTFVDNTEGAAGLDLYGSNNIVYNNLWVNYSAAYIHSGTGGIQDYNAYSTEGRPNDASSEPHGQINIPKSIFVNYAGEDYRLASATQAGIPLPAPYNLDINGNIRGSDGTWDRGAYEYNSNLLPSFPKKQIILIGVDGVQVAHLNQMIANGQLPNFARLAANGGFMGNATITKHTTTETAPGNSELHTGLPASVTGVTNNTCNVNIPSGKTSYERLNAFNSSIALGLVYGKTTCYIPDAILKNAKPIIPWWFNRTNYPQDQYISANYADSRNVSTKSFEFLSANKNKSFYLTMYYGAPDGAGHAYGENTLEYDNALINVDQALGMLLDYLQANNMNVQIILSADHGWNEGTSGHGTNAYDTVTIPLFSNNLSMVSKIYASVRQQCDIAPTILNYLGMNSTQFSDITSNGCGSLINQSINSQVSISGQCGASLDSCLQGTYQNETDNSTSYIWSCLGLGTGLNASCSYPKSNLVHPADTNNNLILTSAEVSAYVNSYFTGGTTLVQALYAMTLLQQDGSYSVIGNTNCTSSPWACFAG